MDVLWDIPLTAPIPSPSNIQSFKLENTIIHLKKSKKELSRYLHSSDFSPTLIIFQMQLKSKFLEWTGLDSTTILQNMQEPIAIEKGHLYQ